MTPEGLTFTITYGPLNEGLDLASACLSAFVSRSATWFPGRDREVSKLWALALSSAAIS